MFRLITTYLTPIAISLVSFGLNPLMAMAQTTYPFNATFIGENAAVPLTGNISEVTITASSTNAPYGLTSLINKSYASIDSSTGSLAFGPAPATFGLNGLPRGGVTIFGTGNDKLFADVVGNGKLDFQKLTGTSSGTFNITGGEGQFALATGTFNFVENDTLNSDTTVPFKSQAILSGSFTIPKTIPEPGNTTALLGVGIIGVGLLLSCQKYKKQTI